MKATHAILIAAMTVIPCAMRADGLKDGDMFNDGDYLYRIISMDNMTCELAGSHGALSHVETAGQATFTGLGDWQETLTFDVIAIGGLAFSDTHSRATSLTIGPSIQYLDTYAFSEPHATQHLTEVTVPGTVSEIRFQAFDGNPYITRINIGEGVRTIGDSPFDYCDALEEVNIPSSVTSLGSSLFVGSGAMRKVTFDCNLTGAGVPLHFVKSLDTLVLGPECKRIDADKFRDITVGSLELPAGDATLYLYEESLAPVKATSVTLGRKVRLLSGGTRLLADVSAVRSVTVLDGISDIAALDIAAMPSLETLTLGADVTHLPYLSLCASTLTDITVSAPTPPVADGFDSAIYAKVRLTVPDEYRQAYMDDPAWAPFFAVNPPAGIDAVADDSDRNKSVLYSTDGYRASETPVPGIYIRDGHKILIR